jgi:hypothetical protein
MRELEREAEAARRRVQHLQRLGHRLLADAVAGDDGDTMGARHARNSLPIGRTRQRGDPGVNRRPNGSHIVNCCETDHRYSNSIRVVPDPKETITPPRSQGFHGRTACTTPQMGDSQDVG